eukprot:74445_1
MKSGCDYGYCNSYSTNYNDVCDNNINQMSINQFDFCCVTNDPTLQPTYNPTNRRRNLLQTMSPTLEPTYNPTNDPTLEPTYNPTKSPSYFPTINPTMLPSISPTSRV